MIEYFLAGAGLRFSQVVVYSSLWIVIGCFVAAFFRRILGPDGTRKFFGEGTRRGLLTGWIMGMLVPVCSLGVIPIIREMYRAKVKGGTIIAFGLTAPLFNPLSVLYGLTLSDPIAIVTFSFCSLVIVTSLGVLWDKFIATEPPEKSKSEAEPTYGIKRMLSMFDTCAREMVGPTLLYILIGILGSAIMAAMLPNGYLQSGLEQDNPFAPVKVSALATPIYTTPLLAMSQIGGMFQHGNSIGAAFGLLILGAGINIGLIVCLSDLFGWKRIAIFMVLLVGITLALAYAISAPLYPEGIEAAGHSHAFDVYSHPFQTGLSNLTESAWNKAVDFWMTNEYGGTYLLAFLIVSGIVFQTVLRKIDLEAWYCEADKTPSQFDTVLPEWVIGLSMMFVLVGVSVASCYVYYPSAEDVLADMDYTHTECVLDARNGKWESAEKWLVMCDDLSRRLEIGIFLRLGSVDEFQATQGKLYREALDDLKHSVEARDNSRVQDQAIALQNSYTRMKKAFSEKYVPDQQE